MNWCKIGIHDNEEINDRDLIHNKIDEYLKQKGFRWHSDNISEFWNKDEIILRSSTWYNNGVYDQIPPNPRTKVCLKCGKISKSYDMDSILQDVQSLIDKKEKEKARQNTANSLRAAAQVRDTYKV